MERTYSKVVKKLSTPFLKRIGSMKEMDINKLSKKDRETILKIIVNKTVPLTVKEIANRLTTFCISACLEFHVRQGTMKESKGKFGLTEKGRKEIESKIRKSKR